MCHESLSILKVAAFKAARWKVAPAARPERSRRVPPAIPRSAKLFLLLWCGFLRRSFLGCSLLLSVPLGGLGFVMLCVRVFVFFCVRRSLLHHGLFLRQLGSLETLAVKSDLGDAHRGIGLPVPAQLLILLLALVV